MLTKMPQVGDKVRAIETYFDNIIGDVYEITGKGYDGRALYIDPEGDEMDIERTDFYCFELVSEAHDAPVGRITLENVRRTTRVGDNGTSETSYAFTVYADADGYDAVERLADLSAKQDQRADLERQIAALQKELAAL